MPTAKTTNNVASKSFGATTQSKSSSSFQIDSSKISHSSSNITATNVSAAIEEVATQIAVATSEPTSPSEGDLWYDTDDNLFYVRVDSAWKNIVVADLLDQDNFSSNSATAVATQQSIKAYVDTAITGGDLDLQGDSGGALSVDLDSETLTIAGGEGIDTSGSSETITISGEDATSSNKGIASFSTDNFAVSSGAVTIKDSGVILGTETTGNYVATAVAGEGIDVSGATGNVTISGEDATDSNKGIASFSTDNFSVSSGAVTIKDDGVILGTETSGNYVGTITGGTGIDSNGATSGEGIAHTLSLDLNELSTETTIADADFIAMVDATDDGSGKITFENLEDAIFSSVSGDVLITEAGVASIQANSVALTTDTTGNYMVDVSAGTLIDVSHSAGEGSTATVNVDLTEAGEAAIANGDYILFLDGGATGTHAKEAIADVATLFAGTGLTASSSVIGVDASQTQITSVGTLGAGAISSGFGAIDIGSSALSTTGSVTLGATSFGDNSITNVNDIALDSISADGTDINVAVSDNSATSLTIKQGSDAYLVIDTADSSESVSIGTGISGTAITLGHSTSETTVADNLTVTGNATVSGNLLVVGDSSEVKADNLVVDNPTIAMGLTNGSAPSADSGFDLGLKPHWHTGSTAKTAFIGVDVSTSASAPKLTYIPDASFSSDVVSGSVGIIVANLEGNVTGDVTGNVTGNTSGTAATVTGAAQSNITSLGTLTTLTVDNVIINGTTIGHTGDTDLMTVASGVLTVAGEVDATSLDVSGDADIDGTLEADAYTVDGTALNEYIADTVGAMVGSNTESGITVAYQDGDNTLDFTVGTLNQDTTGTAAIATTVTITDNESTDEDNALIFTSGGDVDGGNIGLESDGTCTYNPSTGKITATGFVGTLTGNVTGNTSGTAATVTGAAQTNITSLGTLTALTVDNLGINGNTITANSGALNLTPASGSAIVLDGTINVDAGVVTGATSITSTAFVGDITGNVTGNTSGTAATVTTAAQSNITSLGTLTTLTVDNIIINGTNIGHTSDTDSMAIASNGVVTFSQVPVLPANTIDSDHYVDDSIDTAHIADDQVTLAKMAGLARGKIIYGDSSGNPAALAVGSANYILTSDGTDISWAASTAAAIDATANGVNNRIATYSSSTALNGEANLTFDGSALTVAGTVTVGSDGSGQDVTFYSGTSGDHFVWDSSEEKLTITGTNGQTALDVADGNLVVADNIDLGGDIDVDGTLEADAITVDGTALATYIRDTVGTNMVSSNTETGITVTYDTSNDNLDFAVDAAQTGITSLLATDIKIGEDDQTKIDFETADEIHFYANNTEQVYLADNIFGPQSDSDVDLGTTGVRWKDAFVDSITVTGNGDIDGNLDVDGTTNLDAVDIDGTLTVGEDDTGHDVKFFGATSGANMLWDESANQLVITAATAARPLHLTMADGNNHLRMTAADDHSNSIEFINATGNAVYCGMFGDVANGAGKFGVYNGGLRMVVDSSGQVGIGTATPGSGLHVNADPGLRLSSGSNLWTMSVNSGNGNLYFNDGAANAGIWEDGGSGTFTITGNVSDGSDGTLKKSVSTISGGLDKINALRGVTYKWNAESGRTDTDSLHYGVIAQEVEDVVPELVTRVEDEDGSIILGVQYARMTSILIEAVKELSAKVTALENK